MADKSTLIDSNSHGHSEQSEVVAILRYWLANEDIYTSPYVRNWLARTPREEAADILADIARTAQPEPHSIVHMAYHGILMVIRTTDTVSDKNPSGRKAGTRAALLLAAMDDPRCLAPLVRVFEMSAFWQGRYQEAVETALLRFLSKAEAQRDTRLNPADLRNLAERIWNSGKGRSELSSKRADLLLATLQCLAGSGDERGAALIKTIAESTVRSPNRIRIKEAAVILLQSWQ